MRLVRFSRVSEPSTAQLGVLDASTGSVVSLAGAGIPGADQGDMRAFLSGGAAALAHAQAHIAAAAPSQLPKDQITLLAPIVNPDKVLCIGMNYVDHCTEQNQPVPKEPVIFNKFPSAICGSGDDIVKPNWTEELDFEVELVIVIGRDCKDVPESDAMSYVAGYSVAHDVSARDWQLRKNGGQWLLGKCFDTSAPLGPAIVTTDEVGDPHNLKIQCRLNGDLVQDSTTQQLVFKTEALIAFISNKFTLRAGDIILTGTPPGVGCFRKPPLWLKNGDVVECIIENLGSISNRVVVK